MSAIEAQLALRRGLIADILHQVALGTDVGPDARNKLLKLEKALRETPGLDGTCRTCGLTLRTQYQGRPRVYCDVHSDMRKPSKQGKSRGKVV